jgi:ATP-binding cassette subfamily B multidrug efflux pump
MSGADWRLAMPTALWFLGYILFLWHFVPRMRDLANASSALNSAAMGRIVDSYSNILTLKLFSRSIDEDAYVREAIDAHTTAIAAHMRLVTKFMTWLSILNAMLLASTVAMSCPAVEPGPD